MTGPISVMLKAWWDNLPELETIHPLFKKWKKEHSGAYELHRAVSFRSGKILQRGGRLVGQTGGARKRDLQLEFVGPGPGGARQTYQQSLRGVLTDHMRWESSWKSEENVRSRELSGLCRSGNRMLF